MKTKTPFDIGSILDSICKGISEHRLMHSDIPTWVWALFAAVVLGLLLQPQEAQAWELLPSLSYSEAAPTEESFSLARMLVGLGALACAFMAGKIYGEQKGNKEGRGEIEVAISLARKLVAAAQNTHEAICNLEDIVPDAKGNVCPIPTNLIVKSKLSVWPWQVPGVASDWGDAERTRFKEGYSAGLQTATVSLRKSSLDYACIAGANPSEEKRP